MRLTQQTCKRRTSRPRGLTATGLSHWRGQGTLSEDRQTNRRDLAMCPSMTEAVVKSDDSSKVH
ncbi:hypothetical protein J6590_101120 [Homalodisca vitripennis]|nr:hypothetical protein J6590_101120 [Homalodisca vitripennis]